MAEIRNLTRNGETFYPLTCSDAVLNRDGEPLGIVNDIFDVSEYNASGTPPILAKYDTLSLALAAVPVGKQKGGMTIRYVQTSDNKYVQYRYMGTATTGTPNPFLDTNNWQKQGAEVVISQTNQLVSLSSGNNDTNAVSARALYMIAYPFSLIGAYNKYTGKLDVINNFTATPKMRVRKGDVVSYKVSCNGSAIVACYNEYGLYLKNISIIQNDSDIHEGTFTVPDGVAFVALCNYTIALAIPTASLSFAQNIGDRIFEMSNELEPVTKEYAFNEHDWYNVNGNKYTDSDNYIYSTEKISVIEGMIIDYHCGIKVAIGASIIVFDKNMDVIDYIEGIHGTEQYGTYTVPKNGKFAVLTYYSNNRTPIDGMYAIVKYIPTLINKLINEDNDDDDDDDTQIIETSDFSFEGHINQNGAYFEETTSGCICTNFIDVSGYNQLECNLRIYDENFCAFYFEDKTICSAFQVSSNYRHIGAIPIGAKYVRLCTFTTSVPQPSAILRKVSNYWENQRFAIFGQSIDAGYPKSSYEYNRNRLDTYSYFNQAVKMLGGVPLNYAVPSGIIAKVAGNAQSFLGSTAQDIDYGAGGIQNVNINNRLLNYIGTPNDADVYIFSYHVNDVQGDSSLRDDSEIDYDSTDQTKFVGAYNHTLTELFTAKPNAVVILGSHYSNDGFANGNPKYYEKVNNVLRNIAKKWGVLFIDITQCSEVINNGFINNYSAYMTDAGHPAYYNPSEGIELISRLANAIANKLRNFG